MTIIIGNKIQQSNVVVDGKKEKNCMLQKGHMHLECQTIVNAEVSYE